MSNSPIVPILACIGGGLCLLLACDSAPSATPEDSSVEASSTPSETPPTTPDPATDAEGDTELSWADMSGGQRMSHMKAVVMPHMSSVFGRADANCSLCHGSGAKTGNFAMPSPDLPQLSTTGNFAEEMAAHPDTVKFMMQSVVPEMASILRIPAYDPATNSGFGCFNCHQAKGG